MAKNKKLLWQLPFLVLLIVGSVIIVRQQKNTPYQHDAGFVFGTEYHITYQCSNNLKGDIEKELQKVDFSLSPFNKQSTITKVNNNEAVKLDKMFTDVFTMAMKISDNTDGAFDITVAPLVNVWGFGFKQGTQPTTAVIDSLKQIIGYKKVKLEDGKIVKADKRIMLDCSSIAKGYGCDVVAKFLEHKGIENYMVEIGGEIVTKGINSKRLPWRIGVTKPTDDSLNVSNEYQTVLNVTNKAMATSGNYRTLLMSICLSVTSLPSTRILPAVATSSWFKQRRKVDFPLPDGPSSTTTSPSAMSTLISFNTSSFPKFFFRFST